MMKNKNKKWYRKKTFWVICGCAVFLAAAGIALADRNQEALAQMEKMQNSTVSAEVTSGTIVSSVSGSGRLTSAESVEITAPTGIKVKNVLVETGDTVKKGDVLAELDRISILNGLTEIEEDIDSIEDTLNDDDDLSEWKIEELKLQKEELLQYEEQLVLLKENPVIIAASDGVIDELYLSAGMEITRTQRTGGSTGTVSTENLSPGEGSMPTSYSWEENANTTTLLAYRTVLAGGQTRGTRLSVTTVKREVTRAEGLNGDAADEVVDISAEGMQDNPMQEAASEDNTVSDSETTDDDTPDTKTNSDGNATSDGNDSEDEPTAVQITDFSSFIIEAPKTGEAPQTELPETGAYKATIRWTPSAERYAEDTIYTATCVLTAKEGYTFSGLTLSNLQNGWSYFVGDNGNTLTVTAVFPRTEKAKTPAPVPDDEEPSAEDITPGPTETPAVSPMETPVADPSQNGTVPDAGDMPSGTQQSPGSTYSVPSYSASMGAASAPTVSTASGISGEVINGTGGYYSNYETVVCTIRKQDKVILQVSIDEQDILSVQEGQEAVVSVDALSGREFSGSISAVSESAEAGNGSAKYLVDILLAADPSMRLGMSASAEIEVARAENILTIPMLALQQSGSRLFVYTERKENGDLSGIREVTTGVSDGEIVEITEGLSEGDTVYYLRTGEDADNGNFFDNNNPFERGGSQDDGRTDGGGI